MAGTTTRSAAPAALAPTKRDSSMLSRPGVPSVIWPRCGGPQREWPAGRLRLSAAPAPADGSCHCARDAATGSATAVATAAASSLGREKRAGPLPGTGPAGSACSCCTDPSATPVSSSSSSSSGAGDQSSPLPALLSCDSGVACVEGNFLGLRARPEDASGRTLQSRRELELSACHAEAKQ